MNNQTRLVEWSIRHDVHLNRFVGIVGRHAQNVNQWVTALKVYTPGSFEMNTVIETLLSELISLAEESTESITDLQKDLAELALIFTIHYQETRENDDTPRHRRNPPHPESR